MPGLGQCSSYYLAFLSRSFKCLPSTSSSSRPPFKLRLKASPRRAIPRLLRYRPPFKIRLKASPHRGIPRSLRYRPPFKIRLKASPRYSRVVAVHARQGGAGTGSSPAAALSSQGVSLAPQQTLQPHRGLEIVALGQRRASAFMAWRPCRRPCSRTTRRLYSFSGSQPMPGQHV